MRNFLDELLKRRVPGNAKSFRSIRPIFDAEHYLKANPDVKAAGVDPLQHFLRHGIPEGRKAPPGFNRSILELAHGGDPAAKSVRMLQVTGVRGNVVPDIELDEIAMKDNLGVGCGLPVGETITAGIVLYNNEAEEIRRLLRSMRRSKRMDGVNVEPAVMNNGGPLDEGMQRVLEEFGVTLVDNPDGNIGSSAGHSRLMVHAFNTKGSIAYMTLNPDGFFHPHALERMVRMAYRHDWTTAIEAAQLPNENGKYVNPDNFDTEWAVTACALFPRKIWERVGGFDPNIFLYCDDVDYGWEIRRAGFKVKYCLWAYYFHDYASRTAISEFFKRNRLEAGRYLGHKWRNVEFRRKCEAELINQGFYACVEDMPSIDHLKPLPHSTEAANFRNEFFFAERRW